MRMALMFAGQTLAFFSLPSHGQNGNVMLDFLVLVYQKHNKRTDKNGCSD